MQTPRQRLTSIDATRGLIMVVMALDHARDFLGFKAFNATDLAKTTVPYFMTRWVTHFCAPGFMLLAGTAAFLAGKSKPALSRFLVTRGLWLVFAELTVIHFAWTFTLTNPRFLVIWALGWSMVLLAALIWLPSRLVAVLSIATIVLHNAFDGIRASPLRDAAGLYTGTAGDWVISLLHQGNAPVGYPLIPWFAVMALGYVMGPLFTLAPERRQRLLVQLGLGTIGAFIVLRAFNVYGDAAPWTTQPSSVFTALSFLNATKYPPSLAYLLMTLGPLFLVLAAFERIPLDREGPLVIFGRVPFFFYALHLGLLHLAGVAVGLGQGFDAHVFFAPFSKFPKDFGLGLGWVYAGWVGAVLLLFFPSRWFAALKSRRKDWWLSYL